MSEQHTTDLASILRGAREELQERWDDYRDDFGPRHKYAADVVAEIADSSVPVYTSDLLKLGCEENSLAAEEPEFTANLPGALGIIAANVYERISSDLFEHFGEIQKEARQ